MSLRDIRNGNSFTFTAYDGQVMTQNTIGDDWRRGFDIGLAVGAGNSAFGPGQGAIGNSLGSVAKMSGFKAGLTVQYDRTKAGVNTTAGTFAVGSMGAWSPRTGSDSYDGRRPCPLTKSVVPAIGAARPFIHASRMR